MLFNTAQKIVWEELFANHSFPAAATTVHRWILYEPPRAGTTTTTTMKEDEAGEIRPIRSVNICVLNITISVDCNYSDCTAVHSESSWTGLVWHKARSTKRRRRSSSSSNLSDSGVAE